MGSVFILNCFAQNDKVSTADKIMDTTQTLLNKTSSHVKLYHVEEKINMKFGGFTTIYNVSDSSLVNKNELGPNNTRVVTPYFKKKSQGTNKPTIIEKSKPIEKPSDLSVTDSSNVHSDYAYIFKIKTYERIANKGYKSVDIFKKLGNAYYFNLDMEKAAKWYSELFALTSNVETEYYYRYALSLRAIGDNDKANEMLEKFNQLSEDDSR